MDTREANGPESTTNDAGTALTQAQARADIADVMYVEPDELQEGVDLRDQGIDSVRVMDLVERWRQAGIEGVDFIALAQDQRLERWLELLREAQGVDLADW